MQLCHMMLNEKSNKYQMKRLMAQKFESIFANAAAHANHVTVYMHILQCHVPKFILSYGDLSNYGCQGSEHMHAITKRSFISGSSRQPKKP
jgi:hypothetical protein